MSRDILSLLPEELRALSFDQEVEALERDLDRDKLSDLRSTVGEMRHLLRDPKFRRAFSLAEKASRQVGRRYVPHRFEGDTMLPDSW